MTTAEILRSYKLYRRIDDVQAACILATASDLIQQAADELDSLCKLAPRWAASVNDVPHQDELETIADNFRKLAAFIDPENDDA